MLDTPEAGDAANGEGGVAVNHLTVQQQQLVLMFHSLV